MSSRGAAFLHRNQNLNSWRSKGYRPHKENELDYRFDLHEQGENIGTCYLH